MTTAPKRRWPQFTLLMMFLTITAIAAMCGLLGFLVSDFGIIPKK
jgi:hypothetical protein